MNEFIKKVQQAFDSDFSLAGLRTLIILWAIFVIVLTLVTKNKWILAGILAYEVLP